MWVQNKITTTRANFNLIFAVINDKLIMASLFWAKLPTLVTVEHFGTRNLFSNFAPYLLARRNLSFFWVLIADGIKSFWWGAVSTSFVTGGNSHLIRVDNRRIA